MRDLDLPLLAADLKRSNPAPPSGQELRRQLLEGHPVVIASPEYIARMPRVLQNAIE
jgi:NAD(P)H-dependent FMN reductase